MEKKIKDAMGKVDVYIKIAYINMRKVQLSTMRKSIANIEKEKK